jgi:hypothetical protein
MGFNGAGRGACKPDPNGSWVIRQFSFGLDASRTLIERHPFTPEEHPNQGVTESC